MIQVASSRSQIYHSWFPIYITGWYQNLFPAPKKPPSAQRLGQRLTGSAFLLPQLTWASLGPECWVESSLVDRSHRLFWRQRVKRSTEGTSLDQRQASLSWQIPRSQHDPAIVHHTLQVPDSAPTDDTSSGAAWSHASVSVSEVDEHPRWARARVLRYRFLRNRDISDIHKANLYNRRLQHLRCPNKIDTFLQNNFTSCWLSGIWVVLHNIAARFHTSPALPRPWLWVLRPWSFQCHPGQNPGTPNPVNLPKLDKM